MTPYNEVNIKMRCPQSRAGMNKKIVKLIPKPFNPILPKIEVKAEYNPQTKLLSADEKQKTSFIMSDFMIHDFLLSGPMCSQFETLKA